MTDAADFRRIALALDGVAEYPHFDRRAFRARVTFATLAPDERTANLKFSPDEQALKCAVAPDAFTALDNAWGRQGWTCATLSALTEPELRAALEAAWRRGASRPARRKSGKA
ncbi:YjbR protein [Roseiarcus fermentans]|uniref:YjbR protein n=1 Tax=Roseiarcus fermentans TaxID=1473586 RepID=A0A366FUA0_9HYPH|nr:MmcQ/YjbR family DNA-binding protein [Roseiarcus fermentans]RBP17315.1 YjbR protein [Roseiarcus fermentans]